MNDNNPTTGDAPPPPGNSRGVQIALALLIIAIGLALRWVPSAKFQGVGFDENLYRRYVTMLDGGTHIVTVPENDRTKPPTPYEVKLEDGGLGAFPDLCGFFIQSQSRESAMCELPPTRFLYIYTSWIWKRIAFGAAPPVDMRARDFAVRDPALVSLHRVATLFTSLLMIVAGIAAWRMAGPRAGLGVLAIMATAPVQLHLSQHALIDGFFAFWAGLSLWMLWENLQRPDHKGWLCGLGASLALMVTAKENSFFVFIALCAIVLANRWGKFGTVTPRLLAVMVLGPAAGAIFLVSLAGGVDQFVTIYKLLVTRAQNLDYAKMTGDGPWYRYLVDLMIASPVVLALALAAFFNRLREHRALVFVTVFVAVSYAIMCNIRYAMNLRYASIWDWPLAMLATAQLTAIARACGKREALVFSAGLAGLAALGIGQFVSFTVENGLYEMGTRDLLQCVKIIKFAPTP